MNSIGKIIPFRKRYKLRQEAMFHQALNELNIRKSDTHIDHENAKCINDGIEYSVIFPLSFLKIIKDLQTKKELDYAFIGLKTPEREWVESYSKRARSKIIFSNNGRSLPKQSFDKNYYELLKTSKFSLCPRGDFNWTYRFIESIFCKAIPIVDKDFHHPIMDEFQYFDYRTVDEHVFSNQMVEANYLIALKNNTLLSRYIDFSKPLVHEV